MKKIILITITIIALNNIAFAAPNEEVMPAFNLNMKPTVVQITNNNSNTLDTLEILFNKIIEKFK
jgi:hypothetical protein